jgi:bifunctional DNA-binding transcriptional regulator/antitoxin component of YhaV-PrlF toxin-antitoxin module
MVTIDRSGRVVLPQPALEVLGVPASVESEVLIELTSTGVVLKPKPAATPITQRIAAMNLPVADWAQMEQEIDAGRAE